MAEKESPGAARTRREKEINDEKLNGYGISSKYIDAQRAAKNPLTSLVTGKSKKELAAEFDEYGTQLSSGAQAARNKAMDKKIKEGSTLGEAMFGEERVKAGREAAAEERREARGMKAGGKVSSASSRGDGIAQRGKTRGKVC